MPTLVLGIPETYDSVTRPVIYDVTRTLFKLTGLHENTPILYTSPNGVTFQPGSTIKSDHADSGLSFDDQVTVEVDETIEQDRILSTAVVYPENLFLFHDPRVETMLKPVYSSTEIAINFKFRAIDEVKAKRWREQIRVRMSQMRDLQMLDIRYAYQLPIPAMVILTEIHRLMENVAPYGDSFAQWFRNSATRTMTVESNMSGTQVQVAIPEHQGRIVGYWDFEGEPEIGQKDDNGETWTISFAFKFKYDKPVSIVMQYPQVIHNQVIKYKDDKPPYNPEQIVKSFSLSAYYFDYFNRTRALDKVINNNNGIMLPAWDEFVPNHPPPWYIKIFSGMTTIDLSEGGNPNLLMNLDQLSEGYSLMNDMKSFIIGEAPYMTGLYQSVFSCNLFLSNTLLKDGSIVVDSALNVKTTFNPNPRARFHVWFGLCFNWSMLSPGAIARLRLNYPALVGIIKGLWPGWGYIPDQIGGPGSGTGIATSGSMGYLTDTPANVRQRVGFDTVETFYIQVMEPQNAAS
jgi:hypothetical protein